MILRQFGDWWQNIFTGKQMRLKAFNQKLKKIKQCDRSLVRIMAAVFVYLLRQI